MEQTGGGISMPLEALNSPQFPDPRSMSDQEVILLQHLVKHHHAELPSASFIFQLAHPLRGQQARESIAYLAMYLPELQTSVATTLFAWIVCTSDPLPEDVSTSIRAYLSELLRVGSDKTAAFALSLLYLSVQQKYLLRRTLKSSDKHRFAPSKASEPRDIRVFAARIATFFPEIDKQRLRFFIQSMPALPVFPASFETNARTKPLLTWLQAYRHESGIPPTLTTLEIFQSDDICDAAFTSLPKRHTVSEYTTWLVGLVMRDKPLLLPIAMEVALTLGRKQHIHGLDVALTSVVSAQSRDIDKALFLPVLHQWHQLHATTLDVLFRWVDTMKDKTLAVVAGLYLTRIFADQKAFTMAKAMGKQVALWYRSLPEPEKDRMLAFLLEPQYALSYDPVLQDVVDFLNQKG